MSATRWERGRTELRSVRSRVLATTITFLAAALLTMGGIIHHLRPVGPDESVRRLAVNYSGMLSRIEAAFVQQREFLDDAVHVLRTP